MLANFKLIPRFGFVCNEILADLDYQLEEIVKKHESRI